MRSLLGSADRTIRNERQVIATAVAAAETFNQRARDVESVLQQAETQLRDLDTILASTTPLKVTPSEGVSADRAGAGAPARERRGQAPEREAISGRCRTDRRNTDRG